MGTAPEGIQVFQNSSRDRAKFFLQPLGNKVPIFVANEAFGWPNCWAEGSLVTSYALATIRSKIGALRWAQLEPQV